MRGEKGQVTIFVIVAVIVIALVAIFFFLFRPDLSNIFGVGDIVNPENYMGGCLVDDIEEVVKDIALGGGAVDDEFSLRFMFTEDGEYHNISYLCYTRNYVVPCQNQKPLLMKEIKSEIKDKIDKKVGECYTDMIKQLEKSGDVGEEYKGFDVSLASGEVRINMDADLRVEAKEDTFYYDDFSFGVSSRIYDLTTIAQDIVNWEASRCEFYYKVFMELNPEYYIDKLRTNEDVEIYTITYKKTGETFRLAVRGCVHPDL